MGDAGSSHEPLSPETFSAAVTAVTTAFGDPTRRDIYLFARQHDEGVTAAEVADRFTLHPNVARHHLDKLAAGGYLQVCVEQVHAGAGRPSKHYRASDKQMELQFPARRDDLLIVLLGRALALVPPEQAEAMAEEVGHEYGLSLAHDMAPDARPKRSPPTASPPTPKRAAGRWRSSPSSARSGRRRSSIRSSVPWTAGW